MGNSPFLLSNSQGQHRKYGYLAGKSLGGSHADLRSDMNIRTRIRSPGNRRTDYITDAVDKCPFRFRQLYRSQGIGRFSRLGYGDHDISRMDHRIPVTKFRRIFHFNRDTAQIFDQMFADQSSMPGSTTGNNYNPVGIQEFIPIIDYAGKYHTISSYIDSAPDTIL